MSIHEDSGVETLEPPGPPAPSVASPQSGSKRVTQPHHPNPVFGSTLLPLSGRPAVAMVAACPFPAHRGTPIRIEQMGQALYDVGCDVHTITYHLGADRPLPPMTVHRTRELKRYQDFAAGPNYTKLFLLDPLLTWRLAKVVRQHRIKVVHAHHFEGALCALAVRRMIGGFRVIYDAHTALRDELFDYRFPVPRPVKKVVSDVLDSGIPRLADHVICVSEELERFVRSRGVPANKTSIIPMGVNTAEYLHLSVSESREALGFGSSPVVVYTGNLAPFQGVEKLIRAMGHVAQSRPDARLVIVGRPTSSVLAVVEEVGIKDRVDFPGERPFDEVRRYLAAADVVVLPRDRCPGFPLKLLNYMAAGKAIVAFKGGGRDVLNHLVNAYVAEDGDETSFAKGILECLTDRSLSERMGAAARQTAQSYNMEAMVDRVRDLYRHLLPPVPPSD